VLRIAVVTAHFPSSAQPTHGRPALETMRILSGKVDVQVFYPHPAYPSLLRPRSRIYNAFDPSYLVPGVKVGYFDYPVLPLLSRPFNGSTAARALLPHVRRFAPDLVFSYVLYPDGYAALKIARALSVPVIVMGVGSDVHNIGDRFSAMRTRTVLHEADFLVAISDDLRRRMVAMGAAPEKTATIVSGCDTAVFHPMDRIEARRKLGIELDVEAVVYIGRMDLRKGLRELVDAAAALHARRPALHVYLIGAGPDRPAVESAIASHDAGGYIHALPECLFDAVAVWMTAADVVTLPSYMEGCPNVVLEALACGRPVVATNVGGIPEVMNAECGQLIAPRDAQALAQALGAVLNTSWDAERICAHGGRSWAAVAEELLALFEAVLSARKGASSRPLQGSQQ
jgi:glycosyltransferase involved in cell wall biosynthesis